ncbi:MAG: PAS domain-containing protein, partial [Thermomicrobiaceae bacterium]|nr:PAS domain-containing protein [Thermomicrobiaceae bacterium]
MLDARDFTVPPPDQRASAIVPYVDAGLAIVDERGRLAYVSQTFAMLAGYQRREQLLGADWVDLYLPDERPRLREIASRLGPEGRWSGEVWGLGRDGSAAQQRLSLTGLPRDRLLCIAWPRSAPPGETGSAAPAAPEGDALLVSVLNRI